VSLQSMLTVFRFTRELSLSLLSLSCCVSTINAHCVLLHRLWASPDCFHCAFLLALSSAPIPATGRARRVAAWPTTSCKISRWRLLTHTLPLKCGSGGLTRQFTALGAMMLLPMLQPQTVRRSKLIGCFLAIIQIVRHTT
jgi:hypothetical protein